MEILNQGVKEVSETGRLLALEEFREAYTQLR